MAARMKRLFHELGASIFASKKDPAAVDTHNSIPSLFRHLVHHSVILGASYTGIFDHTKPPKGS